MKKSADNIPKFLSEKRSITLFLVAVLFFAIFFIVVYKPAGYMRTSEALSNWDKKIYTAIQVFSGFIVLVVSRLMLYRFQKKHAMEQRHFIAWIAAEMVVIVLLLSVIASLLNAAEEVDFVDLLWRVAMNVVSILFIPYVIAVLIFMLRERRQQIEELNELIDNHLSHDQPNTENMNFYDRGGKLAFSTRRENVLFVEAADNYSNIHYINENKEDTFILHNSMKNIDESEEYKGLLRCHRGYMVNIDNVKLLRKEKGGLVLELTKGARSIPVSRSYNERVVRFFAGIVKE